MCQVDKVSIVRVSFCQSVQPRVTLERGMSTEGCLHVTGLRHCLSKDYSGWAQPTVGSTIPRQVDLSCIKMELSTNLEPSQRESCQ